MHSDPRRSIPSTDVLLQDPRLVEAEQRLGRAIVRTTIHASQDRVRASTVAIERIVEDIVSHLPARATALTPVLNATGTILHTNLGRASLSSAAREALLAASAYVDVEYDLRDGTRAARGRGVLAALRDALPDAGDVMVVNNGAAALVLAMTTLSAGLEVVWSRGELVEIGDGFRLPELVESTGAIVHEVGTTNRTTLADYAAAVGDRTGCVLKVHPSNFRLTGFTGAVGIDELATLGPPLVVDVGSGLLAPDRSLPDEPDIATALRSGAHLVTASGDKLLGGPQAGIIAGRADLVARLRRHPLARALRVDKLTLAALEATLTGPPTPTALAVHADPDDLRARTEAVVVAVGAPAQLTAAVGTVGGGSGPGVELPGWAVSLPESYAEPLRLGDPAVVGRIEHGRCLLDLRCVPADADPVLISAVLACR
ncbi:MAG TPA: L-seryl-tRNA(Sec) selenium transferase [Candidatus Acidoferrales bacterium]|nr:L-seryl-tRNA(Sec) selenium transferase [Candidatus Acidoferrales bacterium]